MKTDRKEEGVEQDGEDGGERRERENKNVTI